MVAILKRILKILHGIDISNGKDHVNAEFHRDIFLEFEL